jgi:hypothetical protein
MPVDIVEQNSRNIWLSKRVAEISERFLGVAVPEKDIIHSDDKDMIARIQSVTLEDTPLALAWDEAMSNTLEGYADIVSVFYLAKVLSGTVNIERMATEILLTRIELREITFKNDRYSAEDKSIIACALVWLASNPRWRPETRESLSTFAHIMMLTEE